MTWITGIAVFLIAVLTGMGVGSAGLLVIYLTMFAGVSQIEAQGMNLLFFLFASSASVCVHLIKRRLPLWPILILSLSGTLFAFLGAKTALVLPQQTARRLFGGMLIVSGMISLARRERKGKGKSKETAKRLP